MIHRVLGIDPGTTRTGLAILEGNANPELIYVGVAKGKDQLSTISQIYCQISHIKFIYVIDKIIIEGQEFYQTDQKKKAKPQDLIKAAFISGAAAAFSTVYLSQAEILQPLPKVWKKQVPKHIHQKRILDKLRIPIVKYMKSQCPVPDTSKIKSIGSNINDGDWYDILDAVGLALWGLTL